MLWISGIAVIMETASDLILTSYYVKSVNWCRIMYMWEDATVHHPKAFGQPSINDINVGPAILIARPYTIDPARLIKTIHSRFEDFDSGFLEGFLK
jgi:hypothetical protein